MKYLVLFVVVIAGLFAIKKAQRQQEERERPLHRPASGKAIEPPEPMLACAHCGVHLPKSRCVWRDGKPYCSEDHARLGA